MKLVGVMKSGDDLRNLTEHIPFDKSKVEKLVPHAKTHDNAWLSGYICNLSPTFNLYVTFYQTGFEQQEIIIPPLVKILVKNKICERLIISAIKTAPEAAAYDDLLVNDTGFGAFEFAFDATVPESEKDMDEMLYRASLESISLSIDDIHKTIITEKVVIVGVGSFRIQIPFNRQLVIRDTYFSLRSGTLTNALAFNDFISFSSIMISGALIYSPFLAEFDENTFVIQEDNVNRVAPIVGKTVAIGTEFYDIFVLQSVAGAPGGSIQVDLNIGYYFI